MPEADADLAGGDGHHDEREDLAVAVAPHARERDQREVRAVEHQLQAEQHDQRVAAHDHADGAEREDDRRQRQVPGDRSSRPRCLPADALGDGRGCRRPSAMGAELTRARRSSGRARRLASSMPPRRRASTTPPTAATSSRNEAISNVSRKRGQQQLADPGGCAEGLRARRVGRAVAADRLKAAAEQRDQQLDRQRRSATPMPARRSHGPPPAALRPAGARRCVSPRRRRRRRRTRTAPSPRRRRRRPAPRRRIRARSSRNSAASESRCTTSAEHAVERVAQHDDADGARDHADCGEEEDDTLLISPSVPQRGALESARRAASPW